MTISLANKYRPKKLKDLKGQDLSIKFLSHLIQYKISKNIIFKGEFGTGKTTSARIYAKAMLCTNIQGVDSCNECDSCKMFDSNLNKDYLEFDAASKGSIDNIRQLLDAFNSPPIFSKKKIWVIDEAHSMSSKAWDSLLKTIEEPKEFQIILFCTNYPEKIRPAILSRCLILQLNNLDLEESKLLVSEICNKEHIKIDSRSINIIAYLSKGHSRDLLKHIEQISYLDNIESNVVLDLLVGKTYKNVSLLYNVLISENYIFDLDQVFSEIIDYKKDLDLLLELLIYLKAKMIYNTSMTSLSIDKIMYKEELLNLIQKTYSFLDTNKLQIFQFFTRIEQLIFAANISSNVEFKFLMFSICESLNKEKNIIVQDVKNKKSKGRRFNDKHSIILDDTIDEDIKSTNIKADSKSNLKELESIEPIVEISDSKPDIQEDNKLSLPKKVYSFQLYGFNFTKQISVNDIIILDSYDGTNSS